MDKEQEQINATVRAGRLHALTQVPEWSEFKLLLDELYDAELGKLIEKENPESRGMVKCIDLIWSKLFDGIRFGRKSAKSLSETYADKIKGDTLS
jgi:hypothetical protein